MNFTLETYFDFINYCKNEDVEIVGKTQKHHIIPKHIFRLKDESILNEFKDFLDISYINDNKNLIELSVENHYIAHILLSAIFEDRNRHVRKANLSACCYILLELNMSAAFQIAHREKISIRESNVSDEKREQISQSRTGSKRSPESIQKQKNTIARQKETEEYKERAKRIGEKNKGQKRQFSLEWYEKHRINSEKNKEYKHTPEAIEKIRQAGLGRKMSDECIEKRKKFWKENPDALKNKALKMAETRKANGSYKRSKTNDEE